MPDPGTSNFNDSQAGLAVIPYISFGFLDPTVVPTAGTPGSLYLRLAPLDNFAAPIGLFLKTVTDDVDTNWVAVSGGGGGGTIITKDEGFLVDALTTTLNFVGPGVTAASTGPGLVDVTIPGGASDLIAGLYFVSSNGNDITGDGSLSKPFATIQAAVTKAVTDGHTNANPANVLVMPKAAVYPGFVTSPGVNVMGLATNQYSVNCSTLDIQPDGAGIANNSGNSISNINFVATAGLGIAVNMSNNPGYWKLFNCSISNNDIANTPLFVGVVGGILDLRNCVLENQTVTPAIQCASGTLNLFDCEVKSQGTAIEQITGTTGIVNAKDTLFRAIAGGFAIDVAATTSLTDCQVNLPGDLGDGLLIESPGVATVIDSQIQAAATAIEVDVGATLFKRNITFINSVVQTGAGVQTTLANSESDSPVFVFKPGGQREKNIYTTWADLYAALALADGPKTIFFDDSIVSPCVIPAGAYALEEVTFDNAQYGRVASVQVANGVTWTGLRQANQINIEFLNTATVESPGAVGIKLDGCQVTANGTAAIWEDSAGLQIQLYAGSALNGSATASCVNVQTGQTFQLVLAQVSSVNNQAISSPPADPTAILLVLRPDETGGFTAQAAQFGGTTTDAPLQDAKNLFYNPAVPANWAVPPTQVAQALDELAAVGGFTPQRDKFTIAAPDIVNGYLDLSQTAQDPTVIVTLEGAASPLFEGVGNDYQLSVVGLITRVTFDPAIVATWVVGQKVAVNYWY